MSVALSCASMTAAVRILWLYSSRDNAGRRLELEELLGVCVELEEVTCNGDTLSAVEISGVRIGDAGKEPAFDQVAISRALFLGGVGKTRVSAKSGV